MSRHPATSRSKLSLVLACAVLLGACSSDGSDGAASTTTAATDEATTSTAADGPTPTTETAPGSTEGGGEETGDRQGYVDAFASGYASEGDVLMTPSQAQCLGGGYVDVLGVAELQAAGVTPESITEGSGLSDVDIDDEAANELYEQFAACDIDPTDLYLGFAEAFLDEPLTDEQMTCLDGVLTEENLRRSFVADVTGVELDPDPIDAADDCAPLSLGVDAEVEPAPTIAIPDN